jgi:acid phosphatase type 7
MKPKFLILSGIVLFFVTQYIQLKAEAVTVQPQLDPTPAFSLYLPLVLVPESPPPEPTPEPTPTILIVAGDICQFNHGGNNYTGNCKKTGDLVRSVLAANPGTQVQTLGDNVNNYVGTRSFDTEYQDLYAPNWGSFLNVTHPAMGNHDTYPPSGTGPYFGYFSAAAGPRPGGYYSYDIGANWHVIVLNSNCGVEVTDCIGSAQTIWLENDLKTNNKQCVLAVWHHPRWTVGSQTDTGRSADWWNLLYQYKVDIVANGHMHWYERFNLIDPQENAAPDGIREFVVGTGGAPDYAFSYEPLQPNEAIRNQKVVYGVLKLTLSENSYDWNFLPVAGGYSFTDSGTSTCH